MFWKCVRYVVSSTRNKYLYSILPSLDGVIALEKLKRLLFIHWYIYATVKETITIR